MTTEEQQLVERLKPSYVVDAGLNIIMIVLRDHGAAAEAQVLNEWIVANNALKAKAADTITRLVEEAEAPRVGALAAIADIREVTGLGAKPMLTELAGAVKTLLSKYAYERDAKHQMFLYEAEKHSEWLEKFKAEESRARTAEAKVAELQEALKPFAREAEARANLALGPDIDHWPIGGSALTLGDLRRALEASK